MVVQRNVWIKHERHQALTTCAMFLINRETLVWFSHPKTMTPSPFSSVHTSSGLEKATVSLHIIDACLLLCILREGTFLMQWQTLHWDNNLHKSPWAPVVIWIRVARQFLMKFHLSVLSCTFSSISTLVIGRGSAFFSLLLLILTFIWRNMNYGGSQLSSTIRQASDSVWHR